jgi:hypothetical protein
MSPLTSSLFKGMLSIFLLAMGVSSAQQLYLLKEAGFKSIVFGIVAPICMSTIAIIISLMLGLSVGDSLLLAMLFGSASYIAVPAAMSETIPEGNIGLMIALALVVTFIFNISLGIPLYLYLLS